MSLQRSRSCTAQFVAAWFGVLAFLSCAVGQEAAFEVIHVFDKSTRSTEGAGPGKLSLGPDGALYGTTGEGGPSGGGTVFRMTLGGAISTLHIFGGRDGMNPDGCLLLGSDGAFYGTTSLTRMWGVSRSTVFRITPQGQFSEVYVYPWNDENPATVVVKGSDGQAYEVSLGRNVSFQLIGDRRFAETLPTVSIANRERDGDPLPIKSLFDELPSESVSMTDAPPVAFSGSPKRPLCGARVADLYGRVWESGGSPTGLGALAFGPIGRGPENGLVAWFFPPAQPPQKNPDFQKVFNMHGQYVASAEGGVYVLSGNEIVQINREGRAPAVASIAALLDGGDGRDRQVDGLLAATDGYLYGQVVTRRIGAVQMFRFRPHETLEVLKMPPTGGPLVHFMDLTELVDGSFIGPADGANGPGSVIVRLMVR
jgi:uncharacterized repeat protein (TIGR03803 family)